MLSSASDSDLDIITYLHGSDLTDLKIQLIENRITFKVRLMYLKTEAVRFEFMLVFGHNQLLVHFYRLLLQC